MTAPAPQSISECDTRTVCAFIAGVVLCGVFLSLLALAVVLMFPQACAFTNAKEQPISITRENLDAIKVDAYTRGHIDGRCSRIAEESTIGYVCVKMGVQQGYEPNNSSEWREYANKIAGMTP